MAREIKVRAWGVECKKMILPRDKRYHQYFMSFCGNIFLRTTESMSCFGGGDQLHWSMREKILMQYTGLTDKNGTEIYEGDVIKYESLYGDIGTEKVSFEDGMFCVSHLALAQLGSIEILGNIHENPELI